MFSVIPRGKAKHEVHQSPQKDPGVPSSLEKKFIRATTFGLKPDGREDLRVGNPKSTNSWAKRSGSGRPCRSGLNQGAVHVRLLQIKALPFAISRRTPPNGQFGSPAPSETPVAETPAEPGGPAIPWGPVAPCGPAGPCRPPGP